MPFDVFIMYAGKDKIAVARPLADDLKDRGWSVWFDETEIGVGDSVTRAIDRGLSESRLGVAVLSPAFFSRSWPARELDSFVLREAAESRSLVLPVWHNVKARDVRDYSPALAARVAINTDRGISAVADAIEEVLKHSLDLLTPGALPTAIGPDGRALDEDDPARIALDYSVVEFNDQVIEHLAREPELMYELSPRRFEELVAELYSRAGFEVELTPASGDQGVDVYAVRRDGFGSTLVVVQAKRYKPELKIEAKVVRELLGTVDLTSASAGVLITTSSFQPGAEALADKFEYRLSLRDYARLQTMLRVSAARPRRGA